MDYAIWEFDSDNIAGDLTKRKERLEGRKEGRKEGKKEEWEGGRKEIHPPRSSAKQIHIYIHGRVRSRGVTSRRRHSHRRVAVEPPSPPPSGRVHVSLFHDIREMFSTACHK